MKIKKILVSQPKPSSEKSPYYDIAKRYGVNIVFRPFIKVEGLTSKEFRQQKISIPEYTAVIFTARTAIDHFFRLCEELRVTIGNLSHLCTVEHDYETFHLSMECFLCEILDGTINDTEHENLRWLDSGHLWDVEWLPADIKVVEALEKRLSS